MSKCQAYANSPAMNHLATPHLHDCESADTENSFAGLTSPYRHSNPTIFVTLFIGNHYCLQEWKSAVFLA